MLRSAHKVLEKIIEEKVCGEHSVKSPFLATNYQSVLAKNIVLNIETSAPQNHCKINSFSRGLPVPKRWSCPLFRFD